MVDSGIIIRRAVPADAKLLAEMSASTFHDTFHGTCTEEDMQEFIAGNFNIKTVNAELLNPADYYFIAEINGVAVGYLRLKEDKSEVDVIQKYFSIELKRIYVLKEFLSKRIGAALMVFALDFAAQRGYDMIWLGVWEHNERAKLFYKKFDFKETGISHPFPIGNTPQTDNWLYRFVRAKHGE